MDLIEKMDIEVKKINESFCHISCERGIARELSDYFSFLVPGHQFIPSFRNKLWDGKLNLCNLLPNGQVEFPVGLLDHLSTFCEDRNYSLQLPEKESEYIYSREYIEKYIETLNIHSQGKKISPRDYQIEAIIDALNVKRRVLISPTSCLDPDTEIDVILDIGNCSISTSIFLDELEEYVKSGMCPKILTPSGYEEITDVYIKHGDGVDILFDDHTEIRGANYHQIKLDSGEWCCLKDLYKGQIINEKVIVEIIPVAPQDWIDFTIDAEHESYIIDGITHHNSGKSLILYCIVRFLIDHNKERGILIVPNVSLCHQLFSDFDDYSTHVDWRVENDVHKIYSGTEKFTEHKLIISTWQSISAMLKNKSISRDTKQLLEKMDYVLVDECHGAAGREVSNVVEKCINAKYKIGVTGTLNGTKIHSLQLEALFGNIKKVITTKELMDTKQVSDLKIKCIVLKYPEEIKKSLKKIKYQEELGYLISDKSRNKFIANLALSTKGNTLLLFNFVEKHGELLFRMISESKHAENKKIYFIHGGINSTEREEIRRAMEHQNNVILIGSVGTVSTGTNIRNLHNIIFASPSKSRIRNLQAIGRILRLHNSKEIATLFDIADDLRYKKHTNYTMVHFFERLKTYDSEKFDYKIINVELNNV